MKHDTSCAVPKEDRWLTDYWYETLDDPPEPPPRESARIIIVTLNPDPPALKAIKAIPAIKAITAIPSTSSI